MAVTVASILERATFVLKDAGNIRWTPTELVDWVNDGQRALVNVFPDAKIKTEEVVLVAGAKQTNPTGCIEIIEMRQNANGKAVLPCTRAALDAFSRDWMTTPTSAVVQHYMDDPNPEVFYVYPAQNTTPATVSITYTCLPDTVSSGDSLDIRDIYANNVLNYVLYRAFSKDAEVENNAAMAAAYFQSFSNKGV